MDQSRQPSASRSYLEPPSPSHAEARALPGDPAWEDDRNRHCVASSDLSIPSNTTETASSTTRISRYADMGLNRPHPLVLCRTPDTRSHNTVEAAEPKSIDSVRMKNYLKTLDEEEEEDFIVPEELWSLSQQPEAPSAYEGQPINKTKTAQYTVPILTDSGWRFIDSAATANTPIEGISKTHMPAVQEGDATDEESSVVEPSSGPMDMDGKETGEHLEDIRNSPWRDDKYFDHYGYLNYTNNFDDSKDVDELDQSPKDRKRANRFELKVAGKKGVQLGIKDSLPKSPVSKKPLASRRQPTKSPANTSSTKDTLANDANQPIRGTVEIHDEAKGEVSSETSSEEAGKWELLEGNVDAPRTGNVSVHKLTIKLRHTVTGELKTVNYTDVKHEDIDWKSKPQIAAIIKWRTDIFHEHGLNTKKNMVMYTPLEDAWMMLFHRKLRASIQAGHVIKLPGPATVRDAFNAYFEGRVLKDANGEDVGSRLARDTTSIRGKLDGRASKIAKERKEMRKLLEGKEDGAVFVPGITEEELEKFQEDGTVAVDDPDEAGKSASSGGEGKRSMRSSPKWKREEGDS